MLGTRPVKGALLGVSGEEWDTAGCGPGRGSPVFTLEPVGASLVSLGRMVEQEREQHKAGRLMAPHYTGRAEPTRRGKAGRAASWEPHPRADKSPPF